MANNRFEVTLSLKEADAVKRGLQSLGADGERALKRLEQATQPASKGLQLLNEASGLAQGSLQELASHGGAAGEALAVFGKGGLAAAAGLGAIAIGIAALLPRVRDAVDKLDDLGDSAAKIGVSGEALQELRFAFDQLGVPIEATDSALAAFAANVGKVGLQGDETAKKVRIAFAALGISLEEVQRSDPTALLQRVATAISGIGDTARQAAIAKGLGIEELLPALREGGQAIDDLRQKARELGIVLDEDLVRNVGEAKNQLTAMTQVVDAQMTQALVNATPIIVGLAKAFASVAEQAGLAIDRMKEVEERASHTLKVEVDQLNRLIELRKKDIETARSGASRGPLERGLAAIGLNRDQDTEVRQLTNSLADLQRERDRRIAELDARQAALNAPRPKASGGVIDLDTGGRRTGGGGMSEAVRDAQRDAKAIADLQQEIALFGRTRDEAIDKATSRLSDHATADQVAQAKALAGQLYDLGEAQKAAQEAEREHQRLLAEGKSLYEATRTPAEEYADTLARLNALQQAGAIDQTTYNRALDDAREKAAASDREMAEAHQEWLDQQQHGVDLMGMANDAATMFGSAMTTAFEDAIVEGAKFQDVLTALASDLQRMVLRMAMAGLLKAGATGLNDWFSSDTPFAENGAAGGTSSGGWTTGGFQTTPIVSAHGNAFDAGRLIPFSRGGLVDQPTIFPLARGAGLMGEAGPEAIAPLRRTASGDLGVQAVAPVVKVTVNNSSNAQVSTETKQDQNGNLDIIFTMVENRMAEQMSRPGTRLNRAVSAANRPVVSR